jgi:hypothetical protein
VGLTETDHILYLHESKDFKLNVADMEIWKNNKLDTFIFFKTMYILKSVPNAFISFYILSHKILLTIVMFLLF